MTELSHDYWKKYIEADILEREKLLKPIITRVIDITLLQGDIKEHVLKTLLSSYFNDLIDTLEAESK